MGGGRIHKIFRSKATIQDSRKLARSVTSALQQAVADQDTQYELELVITEACYNVIIHGYDNDERGDIEAHIFVDDQNRLVIEIVDWGKPFTGPGEEVFEPEPDRESGRGIFIISQISDRFSYEHAHGKNFLRIEKDLDKKDMTGGACCQEAKDRAYSDQT